MAVADKPESVASHITETQFWHDLMHDVYGPRKGGAIIFIDAENARKGVAKTSCAVAVARLLSRAFGYDLKKDDMTLSGENYLRRYNEHPGEEQPSVLVIDEFVGAGTGDSRRAMSNDNVRMGRVWQMLRAKRVVTLATLPDWNDADVRLQKLADYRLWCREEPMGVFQPYKITTPFSGSGAPVRTERISENDKSVKIAFPNMDANEDRFYRHLTEEKHEVIDAEDWDADEVVGEDGDEDGDGNEKTEEEKEREEKIKAAIEMYEPWNSENPASYEEIAIELEDVSSSWVGQRVREWQHGSHRDLVPHPINEVNS
jgi:hypothetical protein